MGSGSGNEKWNEKWGQGANLDKMPVKSPFSKHHREKPAFRKAAWPSFFPDLTVGVVGSRSLRCASIALRRSNPVTP